MSLSQTKRFNYNRLQVVLRLSIIKEYPLTKVAVKRSYNFNDFQM